MNFSKDIIIAQNYINIGIGLTILLCIDLMDLDTINVIQNIWTIIISIAILVIIFNKKKQLIRPISFFAFSIFMFMISRLILKLFTDLEIVEAGKNISNYNVLYSSIVLGIGVSIIILSCFFSSKFSDKITDFFFKPQIFSLNRYISIFIVILGIISILIFLQDSFSKIYVIKAYNYLEVAGTGLLESGIKYFTIGKLLLTVWVILGRSSNRFYYSSLILGIGAIGFLFIGLRGYAFSYFLLLLYYQNSKKPFKIKNLFLIGIASIVLSSFVLEYRIGFSVSEGIKEIIINTLHSQGASFEVVFGSVIFREDLWIKFPIIEFIKGGNFGAAIDNIRSVNFDYGGFASSWFAEAYYLGNICYFIFSIILGIIISILDSLAIKKENNNRKNNNFADIILFLTIPNLVFFARSGLFDLIFKTIQVIIITVVLIFIGRNSLHHRSN